MWGKRSRLAVIGLAAVTCACQTAPVPSDSPAPGSSAGPWTAEAAIQRLKASAKPFRGLAAFAVAHVDWFGRNGQSDTLTFYSYWTGYFGADAKLYWVVRRDTGTQAGVPELDLRGGEVPGEPARAGPTTWLWSETCPALIEAMGSLNWGELGFSAWPYPPMKPIPLDGDRIVVSSADFHSLTFWAMLHSTRIEASGPMPSDGVGDLVYRVVRIFDGGACSMSAEPDIPNPTR